MLKMCVYLAGYNKDIKYRLDVIKKYGDKIYFLDPMTLSFEEINKTFGKMSPEFLVKRDKNLIDNANILVVKIEYLPYGEMIIGSLMEIMYAFTKGIPVYVVSSELNIRKNAWISYHSKKSFSSMDECFDYILEK